MNQMNPRAYPNRSTRSSVPLLRMRYWLVCLCLIVWAALIVSKLFWLQILRHKEFVEKATRQQDHTFAVAPRRGVLYDRNLRELAMTVQADSVYAVPSEIDDKKATVHALAQIVHHGSDISPVDAWTSEDQIMSRVNASHGFAWIARRLSPEVAAQVKALNLKGIYFQKEFQRFYPDNEIAAQVLGYVGVDDNGLGGMEQKFDSRLHGEPGQMIAAMDARRRVLGSTIREPEPGENLVLTIDENIQFTAEKALDAAMQRTKAASGTVVVQDVHTGQILALAIRPTFNPNDFRHTTPQLLRDHAVSDVYEPGSTFKLVTYASALRSIVRVARSPSTVAPSTMTSPITTASSPCMRRSSIPATWPPSSSPCAWAPSTSTNTSTTSASAPAPASSSPAKPAACCVLHPNGARLQSAPSP
jgi:cell division protein FtsI (penicillin-binding protein 3)